MDMHLDIANARQEQLRAEAASHRLAAAAARPSRLARFASATRRFVEASFGAPTLSPGAILPAVR